MSVLGLRLSFSLSDASIGSLKYLNSGNVRFMLACNLPIRVDVPVCYFLDHFFLAPVGFGASCFGLLDPSPSFFSSVVIFSFSVVVVSLSSSASCAAISLFAGSLRLPIRLPHRLAAVNFSIQSWKTRGSSSGMIGLLFSKVSLLFLHTKFFNVLIRKKSFIYAK